VSEQLEVSKAAVASFKELCLYPKLSVECRWLSMAGGCRARWWGTGADCFRGAL